MINVSIHGTTGFYISEIFTHQCDHTFVTREIVFTSDRGDKLKVTMFAGKEDEHHLDPLIPTNEFLLKHSC